MAQTIQLKRSATAGNIPTSSDLALGEIAINTADGAVYIKKGNNDIVAVHDNDILHIDTTNSRVGIGTTSPTGSNLHIAEAGDPTILLEDTDSSNQVKIRYKTTTTEWTAGLHGGEDKWKIAKAAGFGTNDYLIVDASGNVGIGTDTLTNKLQVDGFAAIYDGLRLGSAGSGEGIFRHNPGTGNQGIGITTGSLNSSGIKLFVEHSTDGGGVGIGTTSPAAKLSTVGTIRAEGLTTITGGGAGTEIRYDSSGGWGGILAYDRGNSAYKELRVEGSIIKFKESGTDVMTIDGNKVGINDSAPSKGKIQINQQSNTLAAIQLTNSSQTSSNHATYPISIFFGDEQVGSSARHQASINAVREAWSNSPAALTFKTSATVNGATEKMRITSAGNVGIGTTSPSDLLHVEGNFRVQNGYINLRSSYPRIYLTDTGDNPDYQILNDNGVFSILDGTNSVHRLRVASTGITFNNAYTFPTADGSANQVLQTDGSGNLSFADVSSGGGVTISNNANNRVLTGDGTNANAEANLTFDGSTLGVTGDITSTGQLQITVADGTGNAGGLYFRESGSQIHRIYPDNQYQYNTIGSSTPEWIWKQEGGSNNAVLNDNGFYLHQGTYRVGSTTVIDSSRNLTNIGTISSGAITSSGNIALTSNGNHVATRNILARDTNGLTLATTNATAAINIDNSANVTMPQNLTVTGNLMASTIDVGGDLTLDADGGDVILKDGGTEFGRLSNVLGGLTLRSGSSSANGIIFDTSGNIILGGNITGGTGISTGGRIETTNGLFQANEGNQKFRQYEIGSSQGTETFLLGKIEHGGNADGGVTGVVRAAYDYGETVNNCNIHFAFAQRSGAARGHWWYENTDDDASTDVVSVRLVDDGAGGMFVWLYVGDYVHCFVEAVWRQCSSVTDSGTLSAGTITTGTTLFDTANDPTSEHHIGRLYAHDHIFLPDNKVGYFGTGNDLQIWHSSTNSLIDHTGTGSLYIRNTTDDSDIIFQSDDGSGGITNYIQIDGSEGRTLFNKHIRVNDNVQVQVGSSADLQILHDASDSFLINNTGDLYIRNNTDDKDIIIQTDNGSGGTATYMTFDGSNERIVVAKSVTHSDNVRGRYGASNDLQIFHDATDSYITNSTGNLYINNKLDDGDVIFQSDNGSGGLAEYFRLDGSLTKTYFEQNVQFNDNVKAQFGAGADLSLSHNGTHSYIDNNQGSLYISSSNSVQIENSSGNDMITAASGGAVTLFYNAFSKLATKSDGVDITGELQSDSLDVDGNADISGNLVLSGNLTVNGSTVTNSATNTTIEDALIELGSGNTGANANDLGLILERGTTGDNVFIGWDESTDKVAFATTTATGASTGALTLTDADIQVGAITASGIANITGGVTCSTVNTGQGATEVHLMNQNIRTTDSPTFAGLTVDDITINGSTISDGGTLTIDAGGDLILDAAGNDILLKDGGTEFGRLSNSSLNFDIYSPQSNADIRFKGNDGGSTVTALTLDMSNAGTAIFNNDVNIDGNELTFTSDAASAYIRGADALLIQSDYNTGENKPIYLQPSATTELTVATGQSTFVGNVDVGSGLDVTGNITVTGTVDGRDIATDGTKLDTIDTNADVTPSWVPSSDPGYLTSSGTISHANNLNATDDRDIAPEDLSYNDDLRIYFAEKGGLETGTVGSNYQDVLVLNSYTDHTGGDANALAFDKSEKKIYHYQADQAATNWGTAKTLAYTDDITLSTLSITATATELNYTDGVTSNIQTQLNGKVGTTGNETITGNKTFTGTTTAYNLYVDNNTTNYIRLYTEADTTNIADTFTDTTTDKSYIYFGAGDSSNDPGYIMHETSESETNEGVLHLVPSDDNATNDYVSIHGTNDADCIRLHTSGLIETGNNHQLTLKSGSGDVNLNDNVTVGYNLTVTGNIIVTGTVDGRDIATDGTKLDGISSGADVTPSWVPSSDPSYLTSSSTQSKYLRSDANDDFSGTLNYTPDTGTILSVDGQAILQRMTANGAITIGHDDAVIIAGGDTSQVMNANISNATETVFIGAEGGMIVYAFPNNDTTWTNRKQFSFDGANGLNMNSVFTVDINGNLSATTKSFDIEHPSKEGMRLRYGSLEGPENGVYVRGKSKEKVISLPDYWVDLVHEDSITVQLTAIGGGQNLYVEDIKDNKVYVNGENYFYYIQAERKDVERFEVEYEG